MAHPTAPSAPQMTVIRAEAQQRFWRTDFATLIVLRCVHLRRHPLMLPLTLHTLAGAINCDWLKNITKDAYLQNIKRVILPVLK